MLLFPPLNTGILPVVRNATILPVTHINYLCIMFSLLPFF